MKSLRHSRRLLKFVIVSISVCCLQIMLSVSAEALFDKDEDQDSIKDAIVKVYTMKSSPYYLNPWRMLPPQNVSGSGCIVEGNRILTNAHVVADQTFIQVRRFGESKRANAQVIWVSHEADLALLSVDDTSFFEGVVPLKIGSLPKTRQEVVVYGFPVGGDTLSVTKGILSRIEHHLYVHSSNYFLAGQIDAAINPGNSGGPVIVDGEVVGVVMQCYDPKSTENIGYMVPVPVIDHFMRDIEDGSYDGFPATGVIVQKMENPDMKQKYGMTGAQSGVVVNHVIWGSSASGNVIKDDIVLSVDGHPVADDGTVEFRPRERTVFKHFIEMRQLGESVELEVLRNGEVRQVTLALNQTQNEFLLVPNEQYDSKPKYFIYGGIVFSPLTKNFINERKRPPEYLVMELENWPTGDRSELVIAIQTLAADINKGYHDLYSWMVTEVNGKKFRDFQEFVQIITGSGEPYIIFKNEKGFQIVLNREKAVESKDDILRIYGIKEDQSPDMKKYASKYYLSKK